ncbi:MAG: hypothetical protein OEL75_02030, partial [Kiritimatiellaceae bacterium]|nr:hypothetical protein [Kiritimatiellaceae bacterium]
MVFEVGDGSYARCVSIYGRNDEREPWRWVGGGEIHSLEGEKEDTVTLNARVCFLKVHVFHYDDRPLDIAAIRLEAIPRYLVFEAPVDGSAQLYYRAWGIHPPRYDLKGRVVKASIAKLPLFPLLDVMPNATAHAQLWRKYSRWLGILAVGAVSLLVVWIIVSMLRQQRVVEEE